MGAQHLPQPAVRALAEEVAIDLTDTAGEAVGILPLPGIAVGKVKAQPIAQRHRGFGKETAEQPPAAHRLHRHRVGFRQEQRGSDRVGLEGTHHHALAPLEGDFMRPQNPLRMGELASCQARRVGRLGRQRPGREMSFYLVPAHGEPPLEDRWQPLGARRTRGGRLGGAPSRTGPLPHRSDS